MMAQSPSTTQTFYLGISFCSTLEGGSFSLGLTFFITTKGLKMKKGLEFQEKGIWLD